jgi:serine/threonine protein kinase
LTGAKYVIKVLLNLNETDIEARFLLNLDHPNIIKMYECRNFGKAQLSDGSVERRLYFILEHADIGTVRDLVTNCGALNENLARFYFTKLIDAVEHLHNNIGCVHLDIKPMNIFLKSDENLLKLGDFGHAY